jgi:hypothetical protein
MNDYWSWKTDNGILVEEIGMAAAMNSCDRTGSLLLMDISAKRRLSLHRINLLRDRLGNIPAVVQLVCESWDDSEYVDKETSMSLLDVVEYFRVGYNGKPHMRTSHARINIVLPETHDLDQNIAEYVSFISRPCVPFNQTSCLEEDDGYW